MSITAGYWMITVRFRFDTILKPFINAPEIAMPAITVKNIPDKLYESLKMTAEKNHRSINSEILFCLEQQLQPRKIMPAEKLELIRSVRATVDKKKISAPEIRRAIKSGRP